MSLPHESACQRHSRNPRLSFAKSTPVIVSNGRYSVCGSDESPVSESRRAALCSFPAHQLQLCANRLHGWPLGIAHKWPEYICCVLSSLSLSGCAGRLSFGLSFAFLLTNLLACTCCVHLLCALVQTAADAAEFKIAPSQHLPASL